MFKPGQSGNPNGRPKGAKNKFPSLRRIFLPQSEALIKKLINLALQGNIQALKICADKLIPDSRAEAVEFEIQGIELNKSEGVADFAHEVLKGVASNELSLEQGKELMETLDTYRQSVLHQELMEKLTQIEEKLK